MTIEFNCSDEFTEYFDTLLKKYPKSFLNKKLDYSKEIRSTKSILDLRNNASKESMNTNSLYILWGKAVDSVGREYANKLIELIVSEKIKIDNLDSIVSGELSSISVYSYSLLNKGYFFNSNEKNNSLHNFFSNLTCLISDLQKFTKADIHIIDLPFTLALMSSRVNRTRVESNISLAGFDSRESYIKTLARGFIKTVSQTKIYGEHNRVFISLYDSNFLRDHRAYYVMKYSAGDIDINLLQLKSAQDDLINWISKLSKFANFIAPSLVFYAYADNSRKVNIIKELVNLTNREYGVFDSYFKKIDITKELTDRSLNTLLTFLKGRSFRKTLTDSTIEEEMIKLLEKYKPTTEMTIVDTESYENAKKIYGNIELVKTDNLNNLQPYNISGIVELDFKNILSIARKSKCCEERKNIILDQLKLYQTDCQSINMFKKAFILDLIECKIEPLNTYYNDNRFNASNIKHIIRISNLKTSLEKLKLEGFESTVREAIKINHRMLKDMYGDNFDYYEES